MTEEDSNLSVELQNLELDISNPTKKKKSHKMTDGMSNPFVPRRRSKSLSSINFGPSCSCKRRSSSHVKHTTSFKRSSTNRAVLREPVLKFIKRCKRGQCETESVLDNVKSKMERLKLFGQCSKHQQDFRSISDSCKQLSLANANDGAQDYSLPSFHKRRATQSSASTSQRTDSSNASTSCSHQARMSVSPPCDVTTDELASYFETFVHIPKRMSSMAEMMYI